MPFRERVKRAFSRSSSTESPAPPEPTVPAPIFRTTTSGTVYEIYPPGECPPSKYKGAWDQGHQDKLKNFTFQWDPLRRRRSRQSLYSPGGTRMPSRNPSRNVSRGPSRTGSVRSAKRRLLGVGSGNTAPSIHVDDLKESADDDGDVSNVGLSRQVSPDTSRPSLQLSRQTSPIHRRRGSVSSYHHPLARQISPISIRGPGTSDATSSRRPRSHSRPQEPDLPIDVQLLNIAATTVIPEADTPGISPERTTEPLMLPVTKEPTVTKSQPPTEDENAKTETQLASKHEEPERPLTPTSMRSTASSTKSNVSSHHRKDSASTATAMSQHQSLSLGTSASFIQNHNTSSKQTLPINIPTPNPTMAASKHSPTSANTTNPNSFAASTMPKSSPEYDTPFHPDELARALTESTSGTNLVGMNGGVLKKARESFGRKTSRASGLNAPNGDAINKRRSFISLMKGAA